MPTSAPFRYRFTRLGVLIVGISIVLFLSSITSQSGLLLVPIGILAGCFVLNTLGARRVLKNLELSAPEISRMEENGRPDRSWTATNNGSEPIGGISVEAASRELFRLPWIDAGRSVHPVPAADLRRRGVYEHEDVILRSRHPFGLIEVNRPQSLPGRTIVHPAVHPLAAPAAAGYDVMVGGRHRGQRQTASGDFFSGVREQRPGDSLRQIHWPSSAKGLGLMVRTYEEELSGRLALILVVGSDARALDAAARETASLAFAALDEGHHVEFIDSAGLQLEMIPPFDDGQSLLDRLAGIETVRDPVTPDRLRGAVDKLSRKAALHFIFSGSPEQLHPLVDELEASGRKVFLHPKTSGEVDA